jgi:hypothetical protein
VSAEDAVAIVRLFVAIGVLLCAISVGWQAHGMRKDRLEREKARKDR